MTDNLSPGVRIKNMKSIRSKHTKLEEKVTKALWHRGYRFRKNVKDLFGKPDIAIKKYKAVIFIDSCFWHGCPIHYNRPKSNKTYWDAKKERNINRDKEVTGYYNSLGWNILRIWEHELKDDFQHSIKKIVDFLEQSKTQ
jgi:DNA mismatch endonuclease (patch repair protein)